MRSFALVLPLFVSLTSFAEHREHGAHVHGGAKLAIAFDDLQGKIEFKAAAIGIVGFEHPAKSASDKDALTTAIAKFENHIGNFVRFDSSLGCQFKKEKIDMVPEAPHEGEIPGSHSDFVANFSVQCAKSILRSQLTLDFTAFPAIKDLDIMVLAGALQKSAESKGQPVTIDLQ